MLRFASHTSQENLQSLNIQVWYWCIFSSVIGASLAQGNVMKKYKALLLEQLTVHGWEVEISSNNTDWWLEESWLITSIKENYGLTLHILFLVDPSYHGTKKSQAIYSIAAMKNLPVQRPIDNMMFELGMQKGLFDNKLNQFIIRINEYRTIG